MRITYCTYLIFKVDFASKPNFSGNSLRSCMKNMPSITRVPTSEGALDITHVSSSLSSELLGVFCIDPSM